MLHVSRHSPLRAADADDDDLDRLVQIVRDAFASGRLTREQAWRIAELAEDAARDLRRRRDVAALERMRAERDAQAEEVRRLAASMLRSEETLRGALSSARAGLWECRLADDRLTWTDGVYDLFGLPQGRPVRREDALACYAPVSRSALEAARAEALETGKGFRLDAELETAKGERRWMRLSCVVEMRGGAPIRLYGMKQDVSEEQAAVERTRRLAEADPLTGLANRRLFEEKFARLADIPRSALLLVDLDGFKLLNDTLGHARGDAHLKETANRLRSVCPDAALVARIGGDEFAVLFAADLPRHEIERRAGEIVSASRTHVECGGVRRALGASVGVAFSDGAPAADWFADADVALYAAKEAGRGAFRVFHRAMSRPEATRPLSWRYEERREAVRTGTG